MMASSYKGAWPIVVLLAMTGVTPVMALEKVLGVTAGHNEMMAFVESRIDEAEREVSSRGSR